MEKQKGFTIVEVALVLAIAGVIFLMVFIALPGLWASERDSERRDDLLTFTQQLKNFQTNNNRGALPSMGEYEMNLNNNNFAEILWENVEAYGQDENRDGRSWADFYLDFFEESFADPDGPRYNLVIANCAAKDDTDLEFDQECTEDTVTSLANSTFPNDYKIHVVLGAVCYGETAVKSANSRRVAVLYRLEAGGVGCENT